MLGLAVPAVYKESVRQVYEELRLLMRGQFGFEAMTAKLWTSAVVLSCGADHGADDATQKRGIGCSGIKSGSERDCSNAYLNRMGADSWLYFGSIFDGDGCRSSFRRGNRA